MFYVESHMTRNEWIAETAKLSYVDSKTGTSFALIVSECVDLADALEAANVAPWKDAAPALTDTAAKVVEAAEAWNDSDWSTIGPLLSAVRAHLAAKQGGAS